MYLAFGMTATPFSFLICKFSSYGSSLVQSISVKPPTFYLAVVLPFFQQPRTNDSAAPCTF